jgi:hypothetical protein
MEKGIIIVTMRKTIPLIHVLTSPSLLFTPFRDVPPLGHGVLFLWFCLRGVKRPLGIVHILYQISFTRNDTK